MVNKQSIKFNSTTENFKSFNLKVTVNLSFVLSPSGSLKSQERFHSGSYTVDEQQYIDNEPNNLKF